MAPLVGLACVLQLTLVQAPTGLFLQFLAGSALATVGMLLLFEGIDVGILPMGRFIGAELPRRRSLGLILGVAFALGFAATSAEPDVLVLANQVEAASAAASAGAPSGQVLIYAIAGGVGIFTALALLRVVYGFSMAHLLTAVYASIIVLSLLAPADFIPLAYDAGSVTTGVITAPVVLSLALGFSAVFAGRSSLSDGFGLLGLASVGPIIVVLLLGLLL